MNKLLSFLKKIRILNSARRIYNASKYYNKRYVQILKWGVNSREESNYTYDLTPSSLQNLANTISVVTGVDHSTIMGYIMEAENDTDLKETIISAIKKSPLRIHADLNIKFGRRLGWYAFARVVKPKIIIETGIDKGLGSILLCSALLRNKKEGFPGKYYGTDINPQAGYILSGKYKETGEFLYGDSIESLRKFEGEIDLFINDSDHSTEYEYREYLTIKDKITQNTIILGDNSHCSEKLSLFSNETGRNFLFFREEPLNHWYPGAGIGISFLPKDKRS